MPAKSSNTSSSSASASASATKQKRAKKSTPTKTKTVTPSTVESAPSTVESAHSTVESAPSTLESAPTVESAPSTVESATDTSSIESIELEFLSLATRLQELKTLQSSVVSDLKKLHKTVHRHMKDNSKKHKKRKNLDPNRPKREPSGFAKPALISVELCSFLGKPEGTEMARTEVTKYLTQYIKEHKLQDEANRRKILPDKQLQQLLNVGKGDEVTYFNLQKYMKVHFPKSAVSSA
jgi:chromatin remodeling complex protein RSC6